MTSRRSFLKGILATVAIVATASIARAAEDVFEASRELDLAWDPHEYAGEWKWINVPAGDAPRYDFINGQWQRRDDGYFSATFPAGMDPVNPAYVDAEPEWDGFMLRPMTWWERMRNRIGL